MKRMYIGNRGKFDSCTIIHQEWKKVCVIRVYTVILLVDMASEHRHYVANSEVRAPINSNKSIFDHEFLEQMLPEQEWS